MNWIDSVSDIAAKITGWGAQAGAGAVEKWNEELARLKALAREFTAVYNTLFAARENLTGADRERVDALLRRGNIVRASIDKVASGVDGVARLLPTKTLSSYGGLGAAIPLIPIAVIAAAIAAITAWLSDAYVEVKRLNLADKVHQSGGNVSGVFGSGTGLPAWAIWAAGGVGLVLLVSVISGRK